METDSLLPVDEKQNAAAQQKHRRWRLFAFDHRSPYFAAYLIMSCLWLAHSTGMFMTYNVCNFGLTIQERAELILKETPLIGQYTLYNMQV